MAPQTRRSRFPRVVIERDSDSEDTSSSSDEEEMAEEVETAGDEEDGEGETGEGGVGYLASRGGDGGKGKAVKEGGSSVSVEKKGKKPITISLKKVCKVCKGTGHEAGFQGATYIDCPRKPCFLCKVPGHTTMTCPHRVATEHGVVPAPRRHSQKKLDFVFERQIRTNVPAIKPAHVIPDQLDAAVIRLHSRRITCLEFHPINDSIILSGDKKGQLGIWNFSKVNERTVYESVHSCILNNVKFNPTNDGTIFTSSSDGTTSLTDLETGISDMLMNLNPNGWNGVATWKMLYGLDISSEKQTLLVADNFGYLYMMDVRAKNPKGNPILIHKKGTKVVGLHCNPLLPELLLSCGNDHYARIWDLRKLESGSALASMAHNRVVNSAYFSLKTGTKILTTSQDNRIRVWDNIFGDLETPSREIVHSHDFNRHLTCFRAEWDPKDHLESLAVIGRYISENFNGVALHPIDFIDTNTGQLVAEVVEPNVTTISPVNKLHPRDDILATGSSRSVFIWRPKAKLEPEKTREERNVKMFVCEKDGKKSGKMFEDGSDDEKFDPCGKKRKKSHNCKSFGKGKR